MLTQERLKQLLYYNPVTGIFTWRKNRTFTALKNTEAGRIASDKYTYYRIIYIDNKPYKAHRLAFLYVNGCFPKDQIDHIDGR